ncbi:MAG: aminoglycoside phosphotransferase family protein [Oscillospiraceae bacterium]|nr:aminoglycoside phosphotransferase family protein [Oscillospiraceae bacterium]
MAKRGDLMKNKIVKTIKLDGGFAGDIHLIETENGERCIRKSYANNPSVDLNAEWNALVFLHGKGYSVPKPLSKNTDEMYMQYIENGVLWDVYQTVDTATQHDLIEKFTKLLHDLHVLDISRACPAVLPYIENELSEIKNILEEKQLSNYLPALNKLELQSVNIAEKLPCFIHRVYHPWNVLTDINGKLYAVDLLLSQGDFRFDVAWTYMLMSRSDFSEFAEAFLLEYAKFNPSVYDDFDFYKSLANLRWLANVSPFAHGQSELECFRYWIKQAEKFCNEY